MHLSDYMAVYKLDDEQVAAKIGRDRVTVSRIRRRKVRPDWETIKSLKAYSKGAITADDFVEIETAGAA